MSEKTTVGAGAQIHKSARAVLSAYVELGQAFAKPGGCSTDELQGAAEYLVDKIREAKASGVDLILPRSVYAARSRARGLWSPRLRP